MNKTTLRNVKASVEVRELKDELSEAELKTVSGGRVMVGEIAIVNHEHGTLKAGGLLFHIGQAA